MDATPSPPPGNRTPARLPRNVWAVSATSFFMDISTEMIVNVLPLFLANVLGVRTSVIGLIEGVAEATASLLKLFSGWLSDRLGKRKWVAVTGYAISAFTKPLFYFASTWGMVAAVRWADRVGKGVRTAPRDALVADSVDASRRGLAFGVQRTADTAGAFLGLLIALLVVWQLQARTVTLTQDTFQTLVLFSLIPGFLAVAALAFGARDVPRGEKRAAPRITLAGLGRPFLTFLLIAGLFDLGNSSDAFLVLRAQSLGVSVLGVLAILVVFNGVYALVSTPAGMLSDRIGRRRVLIAGWLLYAVVYLGFARASGAWQIWVMYVIYGIYYGMAHGTAKAVVADLVAPAVRGTAYGTYNAMLGIIDLPASLIAGILWQGIGTWPGLGAPAPFYFGAITALLAALSLALWRPQVPTQRSEPGC